MKQTVFNAFRFYMLSSVFFTVLFKRRTIFNKVREVQGKRILLGKFSKLRVVIFGLICVSVTLYYLLRKQAFANNKIYHAKFFFITIIAVIVFILYANKSIKHIETLFLIQVLLYILLCLSSFPVYPYGGDSYIHMKRSLGVAQAYDEVEYEPYHAIVDGPGKIDPKEIQSRIDGTAEKVHTYKKTIWNVFPNLRYIAYIPYASGLVIADALNFNPHIAFLFSELINAWFLCFVMYSAVKRLQSGKMVLVAFFSLPYLISTTSRFSYTPWVIVWITYGCVATIGLIQEDKEPGKDELLKIYVSLLIGCLPKQPYFFTVIFPLVMIGTKKFSGDMLPNQRKGLTIKKFNVVLAITTMSIVVFTLIIPAIVTPDGLEVYSDVRGGDGVSAIGQMKFIVQNPLTFLKYLIENIYRLLRSDTFVYGRTGFTSIGNGMGVGKNVVARDMIPFLLIWYIITDKRKSPGINLARRAFVYLYTACGIAIICTTLYMNYSEVGVAFFNGINPLYLLTLMFPLFYYLRSNKIKTIFDYRKYNVITYGLWVLVLYASIYTRVICNYMT